MPATNIYWARWDNNWFCPWISIKSCRLYPLRGENRKNKTFRCHGRLWRKKEREYYTEFAKTLPDDSVILTAGCAKYRYNKLNLGSIDGIPRVLDAGQCNDSYSLVVIAQTLAKALGVTINDLPIIYNIAWYEQKAVLVLLSLLSLGVKNIMLGPKLPAFISPNVLQVLIEKFNIMPNSTVETDLQKLVGMINAS